MIQLSEHFTDKEFRCHCCSQLPEDGIDPGLIMKLEALRAELCSIAGVDVRIDVVSGYRCPRHNKRVSGARSSQHLLGTAADVRAEGFTPEAVQEVARRLFPKHGGVGSYASFTHIDNRRNLSRWNG